MKLDSALRPGQPSLHQLGMMVPGIVQKQVDQPLAGYIASIAINSMIVLAASTVAASSMRLWPVSRSIAP